MLLMVGMSLACSVVGVMAVDSEGNTINKSGYGYLPMMVGQPLSIHGQRQRMARTGRKHPHRSDDESV
jgi:hypothetical protein